MDKQQTHNIHREDQFLYLSIWIRIWYSLYLLHNPDTWNQYQTAPAFSYLVTCSNIIFQLDKSECRLGHFYWQASSAPNPIRTVILLCSSVQASTFSFFLLEALYIIPEKSSLRKCCPLIFKFSSPFINYWGIVPSAPIKIGITVTFMFYSFFSSLTRSRYPYLFSLSFNVTAAF